MTVVRPLVVMAHGEPRFFCSCGQKMQLTYGRRWKDGAHEMRAGVVPESALTAEMLWYACPDCGGITQEIEVGAVATAEHVA